MWETSLSSAGGLRRFFGSLKGIKASIKRRAWISGSSAGNSIYRGVKDYIHK